ncbi:MAG: NlpC/P60 family protein [Leclercia adecarboxylata]|nr:NlpC/P60 family protein [uncultured Leclercia sp.]MDU4840069.1 NlpC/P60 family protein [Leclercia adecarboxylata]
MQYQQWKGTHYRWGGTTHNGVDCSALMQHLFRDAAHLSLPRTTGEQINRGMKVEELSDDYWQAHFITARRVTGNA